MNDLHVSPIAGACKNGTTICTRTSGTCKYQGSDDRVSSLEPMAREFRTYSFKPENLIHARAALKILQSSAVVGSRRFHYSASLFGNPVVEMEPISGLATRVMHHKDRTSRFSECLLGFTHRALRRTP
ncbi:hypothetical protein [Variovorax sp. W2I14]|uniref:hypothetical protein n=1 Tax=Variovorax sp. W2I14 TaxID=3042290 RepID=UPI003D1B9277